jgi:uncharacterized protein (TIGR02301 family)
MIPPPMEQNLPISRFLRRCAAVAFAVGLAFCSPTAFAQEESAPSNQPAYDPQLLRLSEILGAVHYLRKLCGSGEGNLWRDQMQALIDSENPDVDRRARLIDRFNRGYQGFRSVYRTCTPAATTAIDRYMQEGAKIARDITARYGKS